jgi:hypothetical protein
MPRIPSQGHGSCSDHMPRCLWIFPLFKLLIWMWGCLSQENGASFEGSMLKLLRTLPKVLKYLPSDKAGVRYLLAANE